MAVLGLKAVGVISVPMGMPSLEATHLEIITLNDSSKFKKTKVHCPTHHARIIKTYNVIIRKLEEVRKFDDVSSDHSSNDDESYSSDDDESPFFTHVVGDTHHRQSPVAFLDQDVSLSFPTTTDLPFSATGLPSSSSSSFTSIST